MIPLFIRSFVAEPRSPNPPERRRWDWVLFACLGLAGVAEPIFNDELSWRPLAAVLALVAAGTVLFRRAEPLWSIIVAFGVTAIFELAAYLGPEVTVVTASTILVALILTYALFRWGSGREMAFGSLMVLIGHSVTELMNAVSVWESIGNTSLWLVPAVLGLLFRSRANAAARRVQEAREIERHQLARELHDTVAHHVSAIAIQAQAGQLLASTKPEAAVEVLATIEEAASKTLADMRRMVAALRESDASDPATTPHDGLADIAALTSPAAGPPTDLTMGGDLDDLAPSLETSLYRLAQEALTNARRHSRHATRITVAIEGSPDAVTLTVSDDGDPPGVPNQNKAGYGLVGMQERATLLGGTLEAGPGPTRGWVVTATLPRTGAPR